MHPKKILHPTDYSEESRPALREAAELAHEHGAALVLLHVVDTLGPEKLTFGEVGAGPQPELYRARLLDELHHARPADPELRVEYVLSEEEVVTAILRTAADLGCDLIVMSSHGTSGLARWFTGSVAEEVVRRAACPVLVIKPPRPPEELPEMEATDLHPGRIVERDD